MRKKESKSKTPYRGSTVGLYYLAKKKLFKIINDKTYHAHSSTCYLQNPHNLINIRTVFFLSFELCENIIYSQYSVGWKGNMKAFGGHRALHNLHLWMVGEEISLTKKTESRQSDRKI